MVNAEWGGFVPSILPYFVCFLLFIIYTKSFVTSAPAQMRHPHKDTKMPFPKLRAWCESLGMSRPQVVDMLAELYGAACNTDQAMLAKWESGETRITVEDFQLLATCYGLCPEQLLSQAAKMKAASTQKTKKSARAILPNKPHPWTYLRAWRKRAGMTLEEVSALFDMQTASIHKWEAGKVPVIASNLLRLAEIYGAHSIQDLVLDPSLRMISADGEMALRLVAELSDAHRQQWLDLGRTLTGLATISPPSPSHPAENPDAPKTRPTT